jgi:hypothetical protein
VRQFLGGVPRSSSEGLACSRSTSSAFPSPFREKVAALSGRVRGEPRCEQTNLPRSPERLPSEELRGTPPRYASEVRLRGTASEELPPRNCFSHRSTSAIASISTSSSRRQMSASTIITPVFVWIVRPNTRCTRVRCSAWRR